MRQTQLSKSYISHDYIRPFCDIIYDHNFILLILYSGLLSLAANFSEFLEWAHNLGKFILGCCVKFDCELLL